ncbi:MAG: AAA family ATPase [Lachnospiraceae bacterium]
MAEQKNLKEMISCCEDICKLLTDYEIADLSSQGNTIRESFKFSMIKFGVYLADLDGGISEAERACIEDAVGMCPPIAELKQLKYREKLNPESYGQEIPLLLKYCVLADAGKRIKGDPFKNQKGQIVTDTYRMFGQKMLACQNKADELAARKLTVYIQRMEKFLEEYQVKVSLSQKLYQTEIIAKEEKEADPQEVEKLLEEFNSMIGLTKVKDEVNSLVNLLKVQKLRESMKMKVSDVSKHMVFSGNPGTGKTTVARILADIYKNLGIIKGGQLVEVDRSGLVKGFIGQTATQVQEVVESALGGILFIDEAYTLTVGKGNGDFGQEAVDTLLKAMEDHRDDLIVIVAGYPDLMEEFLNSNPGLKSRFNKFIYFEDYSAEEQLAILKSMVKKQDYKLSEDAETYALEYFQKRYAEKPDNFANARDVRNFMEKAITNHASRVVKIENPSKECLCTMEKEDLEKITL